MGVRDRSRRRFLRTAGLGAAGASLTGLAGALGGRGRGGEVHAAPRRPNIVLIMSDDMGFSDIGCYGSEIRTPNLDRLASNGVRFSQFYNTARCCPTRACLMTGLYPHQTGVGHMMNDRNHDGYRGDLNRRCVTIAEALRPAGYSTYMAGKWHVTRHIKPGGPKHNWPLQRGFDRFYGTIHGAGSFFDPKALTRDNTMISPYADPEYAPETYYYTDAISDHAVRFIREHAARHGRAKPFFSYVAYTAAHWPMHALPKDIAKYDGRYDGGYEPVRRARFERVRELGLIERRWKLSPQAGDWEGVRNREWEAACMEVYAAMVDNMDAGIGRIVAELEALGILDETLVLFLQDNGGCAEGVGRRGNRTRAEAPSLPPMDPKALQAGMAPRQTRDGWPVLQGTGVLPGPADTFIAYGKGWANVSNTPFREYKHWVHEGGIATPLVVHWPAGLKARGEIRHEPGHLIDIMATCVDVSGAEYPVRVGDPPQGGEHDIQPMEGRSLVPAFDGRPIERDAIYWEHEGNRAVRAGKWKLVAKGRKGPWELYDMEADRTEMNDLADRDPERVREMGDMWTRYAERTNVLPWPGGGRRKKPGKKPGKKPQKTPAKKQGPREPAGRDGRIAASPPADTAPGRQARRG